jgi:hypothetical protein
LLGGASKVQERCDLFGRPLWQSLVATLCLTACAASTGILPAGPDTYTVTEAYAPVRGGSTTAKQVALPEANQFCEERGRKFLPMNMSEGPTKYTVTFRCLLPTDPELQRPNFQQTPNIVIEQRNR